MTLKDLERVLLIFAIFGCGAHFNSEVAGDRLKQFANRNCYRLSRVS